MTELHALTIGGREAQVAFMTAFDGQLTSSDEASVAVATFDDGSIAYYELAEPRTLGGPGSGNFGHAGRPGQVGGSASAGGVSDTGSWIDDAMNELRAEAAKLDFPPDKIRVTRNPRTFFVGGQAFDEGASFNRETGEITFNFEALRDVESAKVTLAHEVMHRDWNDLVAGLGLDYKIGSLGSADFAKLDIDKVKNIIASTRNGASMDALRKKDGITDYSRAYWKEVEWDIGRRGNYHQKFLTAINETLAEVSALNAERREGDDDFLKVPDVWLKLHSDVRDIAKSVRGDS